MEWNEPSPERQRFRGIPVIGFKIQPARVEEQKGRERINWLKHKMHSEYSQVDE